MKRIEVRGFDHGIDADHSTYSITMEHVALNDQRVAGLRNTNNVLSIRGLVSRNVVPVIRTEGDGGFITLIDSQFTGGAAGAVAIDNSGKLFLRNVRHGGYDALVRDRVGLTGDVGGDRIDEYHSHGGQTLFATELRSLDLPIEDTPEVPWDPVDQWEPVKLTPGGDTTADIQSAFDRAATAGRTTVYFPGAQKEKPYQIARTIRVHGSVRRVLGLQQNLLVTEPLW
jgi:hypothetical protein